LHQKRLREREFNQAEILALAISQAYNLELNTQVMVRIHMKNVQSKLDKDNRFKNIKGAFKIKDDSVKAKISSYRRRFTTAQRCQKLLLH